MSSKIVLEAMLVVWRIKLSKPARRRRQPVTAGK
jgi:hypothetical protein